MPPKNHALLSASASHRWLNCPPSARLCENYDDKGSDFATEGTEAHALCEFRLKEALGIPTENPIPTLTQYSEEMEDCATGYAAFVTETVEKARQTCRDPVVLIEQRLDYSNYVRDGFGTGDCIIVSDGVIHIIDYKHGRGVLVEAEENPQMKLYALGALELFDGIYDIETVSMTVYQPRRGNIGTYTVSKSDLLDWAEQVMKPIAELAYCGEGQFACGEWCQFCKAKTDCRKRAEANMALAKYDFADPPLLTDAEIEDMPCAVFCSVWDLSAKSTKKPAKSSSATWRAVPLSDTDRRRRQIHATDIQRNPVRPS